MNVLKVLSVYMELFDCETKPVLALILMSRVATRARFSNLLWEKSEFVVAHPTFQRLEVRWHHGA